MKGRGSIILVCEICADSFKITPSRQKKTTSRYCSHDCRKKGTYKHAIAPIAQRFWSKVNKSSGHFVRINGELSECWEWTAAHKEDGYGEFYYQPTGKRHKLAHRVAWEMEHGPLSEDDCVLHHCDNPPCVRESHLWLGDRLQNNKDKMIKGRATKGEDSPSAKLTSADVVDVFGLTAAGVQAKTVAQKKKVTVHTIYSVLGGKHWSHVAQHIPRLPQRRPKYSQETIEQMRAMQRNGATLKQIGEHFCVRPEYACWLMRHR